MAKPKQADNADGATLLDEKLYRVSFNAAAEYRDTRFVPRHSYVLKGKVAKLVKAAIATVEPV